MGAATYIGRVGGLAVALGVGTAVITGHGTALADDGSAASNTASSTSSSASASDASASPASSAGDPTAKESTRKGPTVKESTVKESKDSTPDEQAAGPASSGQVSAQTNTGSSSTDEAEDTEPEAVRPDPKVEVEPDVEEPELEAPAEAPQPAEPEKPAKPESKNDSPPASPKAAAKTALKTEPEPASKTTAKTKTVSAAMAATTHADTETDTAAQHATTRHATTQHATAQPVAPVARTVTVDPPAPAAPANPLDVVTTLVSSVVNWVLGPIAGATSGAPAPAPIGWALLAFARREIDGFVAAATARTTGTPVASTQTTGLAADEPLAVPFATSAVASVPARPGTPVPGQQFSPSTSFVDWVTGNYQPNNTFQRFGIWGTDVGVMWDNGIADDPTTPINENQVLIAFGDTFGGPNMTGTWRLNTLFRSSDINLADGLSIPNGEWFNGNMFGGAPLWEPTYARQIILPERLPAGLPAGVTLIPTAGISVPTPDTEFGATQYLSFMSVRQWGAAGQWTTGYSAMAYSTDNGENWYVAPSSVRMNDPYSGNAKFQQSALVRPGDGYVYAYGTPNGRQGAAYVSRVLEQDILDVSKYEYYSKGTNGFFGWGATKAGWYRNNPGAATAVFGQDKGACGVAKPGNQVSEMSVQYNKQLNKYVAMHADQFNNIVIRTSDTPQGTWSSATVLMQQQPGGIYAPMMHPWSPSTQGTGTDLYWNMSLWSEYNVMLMKTDLSKL